MNRKLMLDFDRGATSVLIVVITLALTSVLATHPAYAQTTTVYANPSQVVYDSVNGTIGTLFNVTVWVTGVEDMKLWWLNMSFNSSLINVTRWYEPYIWDPTYVFYGMSTLTNPYPPKTFYGVESGDIVWLGCSAALFPAHSVGEGFTGDGLLCILTFNITAIALPGETYTCALNIKNYPDTFWVKAGENTRRPFDNAHARADINFDGEVDMQDICCAAEAFLTEPGHPRWDARCDIDHSDSVDMLDITVIITDFNP